MTDYYPKNNYSSNVNKTLKALSPSSLNESSQNTQTVSSAPNVNTNSSKVSPSEFHDVYSMPFKYSSLQIQDVQSTPKLEMDSEFDNINNSNMQTTINLIKSELLPDLS